MLHRLSHANISTTSDVYVHRDGATVAEGTKAFAEQFWGDFLANCDPKEQGSQLICRKKVVL
jgi:hypothetical protein